MKTNCAARSVRKLRLYVLCLTIMATAAADFRLCESLVLGLGQVTTSLPGNAQAPQLGISDFMTAMRW